MVVLSASDWPDGPGVPRQEPGVVDLVDVVLLDAATVGQVTCRLGTRLGFRIRVGERRLPIGLFEGRREIERLASRRVGQRRFARSREDPVFERDRCLLAAVDLIEDLEYVG